MKKNLFIPLTLLIVALAFPLHSCSSDDDGDINTPTTRAGAITLVGTWSMIGYGSDEEFNSIDKLVASFPSVDDLYVLFKEDGEFYCWFWNQLAGNYDYSADGKFSILKCGTSKLLIVNDEVIFIEDLFYHKKLNRAEILDGNLKLYYSDTEYLLFKKKE
jgi:hypothetical protein